ncbi:hypothetical protein BN1232_06127 [Mycobacterium lentiflavum]|uniref:Uncharacterized protein n=1 Tax=Mycobacterium lentiflavum TaxID=141349 RepID=A0A0E4CRF1_MYCLN|nr:hypothetical protein [Mycobacterium lentiflavum]CQD24256.1 hypothetical protein BN1232_06127 [Mycobacterium lentiflavum]
MTITVYGTAHTLGAFRACPHGDAIAYAATLESNGPAAVAAILTQLRRRRYLTDHAANRVPPSRGARHPERQRSHRRYDLHT